MFQLFASGIEAYNQVGLFLIVLFCLGLGGLILGNALYWRVHAIRASGTIIGVTVTNGMYAPVYRYTLPDGQSHEARSDTSSSATSGKETGRVVPLLISAHNPTSARVANNYLFDIIGFVLLVPGIVLGYIAVTAYPMTPMTWIMVAAIVIYLVAHGHRVVIPKGQRLSIEEWKKQHGTSAAAIDLKQVNPIEEVVPPAEAEKKAQAQRQQSRKWAPVIGLFAVVLAAVGVYQSIRLAHLEAVGLRAQGEVVRLKGEWSSGSNGSHYTYYPVVKFRTEDNARVEFKDSVGTNPPSYQPGDRVIVLYLADNPRGDAMIDRGLIWNWAIPAVIFVAAVVVIAILIGVLRGGAARPALAST
jgi:hypothetical protein